MASQIRTLELESRLHIEHLFGAAKENLDSTQCRHADTWYPSMVNVDQIPLFTICHAMNARG
jgi:hypothetical protein